MQQRGIFWEVRIARGTDQEDFPPVQMRPTLGLSALLKLLCSPFCFNPCFKLPYWNKRLKEVFVSFVWIPILWESFCYCLVLAGLRKSWIDFKSIDASLLPSFHFFELSRSGNQRFLFQVTADVTRASVLQCKVSFWFSCVLQEHETIQLYTVLKHFFVLSVRRCCFCLFVCFISPSFSYLVVLIHFYCYTYILTSLAFRPSGSLTVTVQ